MFFNIFFVLLELAEELSRALAASPAYSIEESISTHALHFASTVSNLKKQ